MIAFLLDFYMLYPSFLSVLCQVALKEVEIKVLRFKKEDFYEDDEKDDYYQVGVLSNIKASSFHIHTHTHTHCWQDLEYTDCISCRRIRFLAFKKRCLGYGIKLHLMMRFQFWIFEKFGVFLHCHYCQVHSTDISGTS